jgi:hypothetical protein
LTGLGTVAGGLSIFAQGIAARWSGYRSSGDASNDDASLSFTANTTTLRRMYDLSWLSSKAETTE